MSDNNKIAADLVGAYVSNNTVPIAEFTALLKSTLAILNGSAPAEAEAVPVPTERPLAKVSVKESITPDYLICLDDGKRFKSLRRHLSQLGMTPHEYRAKWSLPLITRWWRRTTALRAAPFRRRRGLERRSRN